MFSAFQSLQDLMHRGGPFMWPLLGLSILAVTVIFERTWFWVRTNNSGRISRVEHMARLLRRGDLAGARAIAESDGSVYGKVVIGLLAEPEVNEAAGVSIVESHRSTLERFMPLLSSLITGAPLLGLAGTVTGLISTFQIMSNTKMMTMDPRSVGQGLAEALLNTVGGLVIALVALFPYNFFRAQIERSLGRMEALIVAAMPRQTTSPRLQPGQKVEVVSGSSLPSR